VAALDRCDPGQIPDRLEGYGPTELRKLLVARSETSADSRVAEPDPPGDEGFIR
jgi:hypothetical protein